MQFSCSLFLNIIAFIIHFITLFISQEKCVRNSCRPTSHTGSPCPVSYTGQMLSLTATWYSLFCWYSWGTCSFLNRNGGRVDWGGTRGMGSGGMGREEGKETVVWILIGLNIKKPRVRYQGKYWKIRTKEPTHQSLFLPSHIISCFLLPGAEMKGVCHHCLAYMVN